MNEDSPKFIMPTDGQKDVLAEAFNIGVGRAASGLSDLVGERVELSAPKVEVLLPGQSPAQVLQDTSTKNAMVTQSFEGALAGDAILIFDPASALQLASHLLNTPATNSLDEEIQGVLTEVGNILLNGVMGSFANIFSSALTFKVPSFDMHTFSERLNFDTPLLIMKTDFDVRAHKVSGVVILVFEVKAWSELMISVNRVIEKND